MATFAQAIESTSAEDNLSKTEPLDLFDAIDKEL